MNQTREEARLRGRRERRAAESSEERETRLAKCRVADRARYAANSDRKTERHRERLLKALSRGRHSMWRIELGLLRLVASE